MDIKDLNGKAVCILGYGREGKSMVEALKKYAPEADITVWDGNSNLQSSIINLQSSQDFLETLEQFDLIIKSPGIPPSKLPTTHNSQLTNSTQIFLDSIDPRATVIGVTGSKGKSTTASLIHHILKEAGRKVVLLGNIGDAAIAHLSEVDEHTLVVLEMSSYQLMQLTRSPQIAVVTSFFPEHLDYHGSLENYKDAKKHITKFQTLDDTVFYYADSDGARDIASESAGQKIAYEDTDSPIAVQDTKLLGTHNLFNIAGAASVARHLGVDEKEIIAATRSFEGLPHRLQSIGNYHGIHWVDDAISTTPDSTIAAIHALSPNVKVLICGGKDRGSDYTQLGEVIDSSTIDHVIVMGETGPKIASAIQKKQVHSVKSLEEAIETAKESSIINHQSSICVLSPAAPSYDQFTNFEEKGETFGKLVRGDC